MMSLPSSPKIWSAPVPPSRLSSRSVPCLRPPPAPARYLTPLVGSATGAAATICSQPAAWAVSVILAGPGAPPRRGRADLLAACGVPVVDHLAVRDPPGLVVGVDEEHVLAGPAVHAGHGAAGVGVDRVVARPAEQDVAHRVGVALVVARAAVDDVAAGLAVQDGVGVASGDLVVVGAAVEAVVAAVAADRVGAEPAADDVVARPAVEEVRARVAVEHVVAGAAPKLVGPALAEERVAAGVAAQDIVAAGPVQGVGGAAAVQAVGRVRPVHRAGGRGGGDGEQAEQRSTEEREAAGHEGSIGAPPRRLPSSVQIGVRPSNVCDNVRLYEDGTARQGPARGDGHLA